MMIILEISAYHVTYVKEFNIFQIFEIRYHEPSVIYTATYVVEPSR